MIHIKFKNLAKSELASEIVSERLQPTIERFPELKMHVIQITLSMDNSPRQAGPDFFKVHLRILGLKYGGVFLEKSAPSLYLALAWVIDGAHERLTRRAQKRRTKRLMQLRQLLV